MLYHRIVNFISAKAIAVFYGRKFKNFGNNVRIISPLQLNGIENISIGDGVIVNKQGWLGALPLTGESSCELKIGSGSILGNFSHIYATKSIEIGKNVLTADKVYISDNLHSFEKIDVPIMHQSIKQISTVKIGDGSWIGENVCIIGCKVGKNCVIGANSVVTKDIPDYSVAVGSPAKVIKQYNQTTKKWEKV